MDGHGLLEAGTTAEVLSYLKRKSRLRRMFGEVGAWASQTNFLW